jgi:hypothetical protein
MDATNDRYYANAQMVLNSQLDRLVQMQHALKFSSMIVAIPDRHQINENLRRMDAAKYGYDDKILDRYRPNVLLKNNVLLRNSVQAASITFFDSTDCLATIDNPAVLHYTVDDHLTAAGHKSFAGCVASPIKKFVYD